MAKTGLVSPGDLNLDCKMREAANSTGISVRIASQGLGHFVIFHLQCLFLLPKLYIILARSCFCSGRNAGSICSRGIPSGCCGQQSPTRTKQTEEKAIYSLGGRGWFRIPTWLAVAEVSSRRSKCIAFLVKKHLNHLVVIVLTSPVSRSYYWSRPSKVRRNHSKLA